MSADEAFEPPGDSSPGLSDVTGDTLTVRSLLKRDQSRSPHTTPKRSSKTIRRIRYGAKPRIDIKTSDVARKSLSTIALRLTPAYDTPNLNKFLTALPTLSETKQVQPDVFKYVRTRVSPLVQLPDMPGRRFRYKVELVDLEINWDPADGEVARPDKLSSKDARQAMVKHRKIIPTWRVWVWNSALPAADQKELRLFPEVKPTKSRDMRTWEGETKRFKGVPGRNPRKEPAENEKYWTFGGPLDINICPTKSDACRVAAEACRMLDKYPLKLDPRMFPDQKFYFEYYQDAPRLIIEMKAMLVLRRDFDFRNIRPIFRSSIQKGNYYCVTPAVYHTLSNDKKSTKYTIHMPVHLSNPSYSQVGIFVHLTYIDLTYKDADFDAIPDVPDHWGFQHQTPTVTAAATKTLVPIAKMMKLINYVTWRHFGDIGSLDAWSNLPRNLIENATERRIFANLSGPFDGKALFSLRNHEGTISPSSAMLTTISGDVPAAITRLPNAAQALALQSAYEQFKASKGQLRVICELYVSLDELALGKSILSKETYCKCGVDIDTRSQIAHYCMLCLRLDICATMAQTPDGRLVCIEHFKNGPPLPEMMMGLRVKAMARKCEKADMGELGMVEREAMTAQLVDNFLLPDRQFRDFYNGTRQDTFGSMAMSMDAVFPVWKGAHSSFVHHSGNVCLTTAFANRLKGDDIPIVLAAAKEALEKKGDGIFLPQIELGFDHYTMIRRQLPHTRVARKNAATAAPQDWWPRYVQSMRSGVYDKSTALHDQNWVSRHALSTWGAMDIKRLDKICQAIENDNTINPDRLALPRGPKMGGQPGAPWLWNPDHMFDDHDWVYLGGLFARRLSTMDNSCDWINDHANESADTLFLTCVILWFRLGGGKDELLGLRMTVFTRHPLRFSIGRALHVEPGSLMKSGWSQKNPDTLTQYNEEERTITMETWMSNRGKWCYSVSEESQATWIKVIREFSTTCSAWDAYPPPHQPDSIQWPKSWKSGRIEPDQSDEAVFHDATADSDLEDDDMEENFADDFDDGLDINDGVDRDENEETIDQASRLNDDASFLTTIGENFIPEEYRERYNKIIMDWGVRLGMKLGQGQLRVGDAGSSSDASDSEDRQTLFVYAISDYIYEFRHSEYWTIKEAVETELTTWQKLMSEIDEPFTEQELVRFCHRLDGKGKLRYIPEHKSFIFRDESLAEPAYDTSFIMEKDALELPYFNCFKCYKHRPTSARFSQYHMCIYCHFRIPATQRWCMGADHVRPEKTFFSKSDDQDMDICCDCGGFEAGS